MPETNAPLVFAFWGTGDPAQQQQCVPPYARCFVCAAERPVTMPSNWDWLPSDQDTALAALVALAAQREVSPELFEVALINSSARLPELASERLRKAMTAVPEAIAISSLDASQQRLWPLPTDYSSDEVDADDLDRLVFASGKRGVHQVACLGIGLTLWRLDRLPAEELANSRSLKQLAANLIAADHVLAAADHLYVDVPGLRPAADPNQQADPLDAKRQAIAATLTHSAAPARTGLGERAVALHVLHSWGGGVAQWVNDVCVSQTDRDHLLLIAQGQSGQACGQTLQLHAGGIDSPPLLSWPLSRPIQSTAIHHDDYQAALSAIIADFGVTQVVISSLVGHSLDSLRTGLPTQVMLHDFYPTWPLLDIRLEGQAADAFSTERLQQLLDAGADKLFGDKQARHWQLLRDSYFKALARPGTSCAAPSQAVSDGLVQLDSRWRQWPIDIVPHGIADWPEHSYQHRLDNDLGQRRLRLLVPGRISDNKGKQLLLAALPQLTEHADIYLLGAGKDGEDFFGHSGVHIVLQYQRDELPRLLAQIKPDAALLLSTVSETFSYTLSEMQSLGLPVLGTAVGSLRERLTSGQQIELNEQALITAVKRISDKPDRLAAMVSNARPRSLDDMATAHSMAFPAVNGAPLRYRVHITDAAAQVEAAQARTIARLHATAADQKTALAEVQRELQQRGDWGFELQRKLKERTAWASSLEEELQLTQKNFAQLRDEFDERSAWALDLDTQLQSLTQRHNDVVNSRSWKLTRPLRFATRSTHSLLTRLGFAGRRAKTLAKRTQNSLQVRGVRGTVDRISEELKRKPLSNDFQAPQVAPLDLEQPLKFDHPDQPTVSIVVPVYNQFAHTWGCLRSLQDAKCNASFEVIVVDDESSDETEQRLTHFSGIHYLRNEHNVGFIGSCNRGAAAARGDYVVLLNNDTAVGDHWLDELIATFASQEDAGLVGAKLVYPDGTLQEAGGIVFADGSGWNYGRNGDPADPAFNYVREVDYCSGAAIMLPRDLWQRLGGFDTRYAPAYYEDTDLAMQVRQAGLKVYYQPAAVVTHFEGVTSGTDTNSGTKRFQVINQETFVDKWQDVLSQSHPAPGGSIRTAREHRQKRQALIIDACTPTPDQDSGSVRMTNLMRLLRELGYQVAFLADNRAFVEGYTEPLQQLGVEVVYQPFVPSPAELLKEIGADLDVVILSRHYVASQYIDIVRWHCKKAQVLFDTVDLHYLREQRLAKLENDSKLLVTSNKTKAEELGVASHCDTTLVVSPHEVEVLGNDAPQLDVKVLSNIHDIHGCRRPFAARRDIFFIGGFQHPPNIDAVLWFTAEVWPLIRAELSDVQFYVIGSKVPKKILQLDHHDGVLVKGFVEDIDPYLDGCKLTVAPLRYGAGVKGKVNMSMSFGQPVVATSPAVEGMGVQAGHDVLVADLASDFAAAVVRVYQDERVWNQLSEHGLANVEAHFSFAAARRALRDILKT